MDQERDIQPWSILYNGLEHTNTHPLAAIRTQFLLTDIAFERTDDVVDGSLQMDLTELWVFGIPGSEDGACFALANSSPQRWEVTETIKLNDGVEGIDCVVKGNEGIDVGFVHLDCSWMGTLQLASEQEYAREIEVCDGHGQMRLSWRTFIASESGFPADDILGTSEMGTQLMEAFQRTGDLASINEANMILSRAVELTPEGHTHLPGLLNDHGNSFLLRFQRTGDLSDITKAASAHQRAVQLTPVGYSELPSRLSNLGNSFRNRYKHIGDPSDIAEAISVHQRAVQLTPVGHPRLPGMFNNLGNSFRNRFEHMGDLSDMAKAIAAHQRGVELTPVGHSALPGRLNNLGNSFRSRFERTGDLLDITEAISAHQRAVQLTPVGHPNLPGWLSNAGNSFRCRFDGTGDLSDLVEAISALQRAVQLAPAGHSDLPGWLLNLGNSFVRRFERMGDVSDITDAISAHQTAVQITPNDHAALPSYLNSLGTSFSCLFERTGNLSDIANSISAHQRAVQLTSDDHADLPHWLSNLGNSLLRRFKAIGDPSDVIEAVSVHRRAVQLAPNGHADLPVLLNHLGHSLRTLSQSSGSSDDLNASISAFKLAATSISGHPRRKFQAATIWAGLLNQYHPQSSDALFAFDTALQLVTLIAGLDQTVRSRHAQLQDVSEIALEAAAVACSVGRADKALEWLEQGRCLVWNQINQLRSPLDNLHHHDKQLAARVRDIGAQLENAGSSRVHSNPTSDLTEKISLEAEASAHLHLAREWEKLLCEVRAIHGFESFLQPPPCSVLLRHLPDSGVIVVINIDKRRCDALALVAGLDEPLHIPLPQFSWEKAQAYHRNLAMQLRRGALRMCEDGEAPESKGSEVPGMEGSDVPGRGVRPVVRKENPVHKVLRGLWIDLVKPILDMLAYSKDQDGSSKSKPRIWWCPTGALSFLPIHAAGIYDGPDPESIQDYVVSSYTPNVTALTRRFADCNPVDDSVAGLFLTSQPDAIAVSPIPGTTIEVQRIYQTAVDHGMRVLRLEGSEVSPQECLDHLERFSSVHLACHGSQHPENPLLSKFSFHGGTLDLAAIIKKDLRHADLAFLSACQTSTGDEKLSEEAVHLTAGMLAAGYRRVVGTMWSIGDATAQRVAVKFYEYLFKHREEGGGGRFDGSLSAHALHHAVQELRKTIGDSEASLIAWIPFVHFGN